MHDDSLSLGADPSDTSPSPPRSSSSHCRVIPTHPRSTSSHRPWTTFLPLAVVLGVSMIKEGIEDYKRHRQDWQINNRKVGAGR